MADTTNTAEIQVVVDASGVEAGLRQATGAAERAERQITGGANNSARSQGNLIAAIQRTTAQMESGGRAGSRYFEILAQQRGVDPRALEPYLRQLRAVEQAQQRAGQSAAQTSNALRQLPAQMTDVLVSLQGGQSPLTVLFQQGGQITDSFGGVGAAIRHVGAQVLGLLNPVTLSVAAVAALGIAYKAGRAEANAYNLALATTGNAAGTTASLLSDAADQTARYTGSHREAAKVLASMVSTGQISSAAMVDLSVVAIKAQRDLGREVQTTVEEFASLGKDPVKALDDLAGKYRHITAEVYAHVKSLQDQGRFTEAATVAQQAHADGIERSRQKVLDGLSDWERGWKRIAEWTSKATDRAIDFALGISREKGPQAEINRLLDEREGIEQNIEVARARRDTYGERRQQALLAANEADINAQRRKLDIEKERGKEEARTARADALRREIANGADKLLEREEQRTRALAAARTRAAEAGLSEAETQKLLAITAREYKDLDEAAQKKREAAAKAAAEALKKEAGLLAELAGLTPGFAEDWDRLSKAYAKGALSLDQLTKAQADLLAKQPGIKKANDEQIKAQAESDKLYEQGIKTAEQYRDSLLEQLGAQRQSNEVIGLSTVATAELQAQRLWDAAALKEQTAAALEADEPGSRIAQIYREQAAALRDLAQAKGEGGRKQDATDVSRKELEELNKFLDPARAQTFGEALREAFGTAGESLSRLTGTLDGFGKRQAEIAKHREMAEKNRGKGEFDEIKYLQTISELNKRQTQDQLASYGSMASAAAGFFGEQSRGYEALMAVSKVFHAAELAMTLAELVPKGIAAVLNQGTGDPYSAFGRMAAMAAIVTGLGVAIGGIGGGGPSLSESRQKAQGTGTVLGSDAKSESISRSLDLIKDATFQGLNISTGMLTALRNIESNITNFAEFAVKTTTLGDPIAYGSRGGAADFGNSAMGVFATGGFIGLALDKLTGGWVGKITGSVLNKLFGGKTTVEDTGFSVDKIDYASILAGGLNAMQYAEIKKEGGLFRSDKYSTQTKSLGEDGNRQFELVLTSLYQSVFEAGKLLGLGADSFSSQLDSFVVDIGKISLDGLDDEAIQKELEAVFSKVGDQLAEFGVAGLQQFQKVGEGYLETLTRVATNYQAVSVVTESLGMVFGDVGTASIAARERLIDLAGGLSEFTSSAEQFMSDFYTDKERADALRARIQPTLDQFGIQTGADDTLQQFRDVVKSLKLGTADGAEAFATLMQIAPAVKQIADVDASKFEERMELEIKLMDMLGDKSSALAASRAIELAGLDASLRPLQQRIYALEDEAAALEVTNSLLDIQAKIYELTGNKAGAAAVLVQQQANALAALDPALRGATQQLWSLEAAAKATEKLKSDASTLLGNVDGAFSALERVVRREKSLVDERIAAEKKIVDKHQELSKSLRGTLDSMIEPAQQLGNRQGAQAQIQAALAIAKASGSLPDAEGLKKALSIVSKESSDLFATQQDYLRDFYTTQNDIASLADLTDSTLSIEEKSLKLLEEEGKRLDSILTSAQQQVDVLKGIDVTAMSIEQAIAGLALSISSAVRNPVVSAAGAINSTYQSVLGRAPDAAGMQFWQDQAAKGVSQADILNAIANSAEANIKSMYQATLGRAADAGGLQFWVDQVNKGTSYADIQRALEQSQEKIPGFASGGMFGGGLRIVGENGPELEATGPSRIWNASQTSDLLSRLSSPSDNSAALAAELRALREENAGMRRDLNAALYAIAKNTMQTADHLDAAVNGDVPLATKVIPA